jgi:hypothetical protein
MLTEFAGPGKIMAEASACLDHNVPLQVIFSALIRNCPIVVCAHVYNFCFERNKNGITTVMK